MGALPISDDLARRVEALDKAGRERLMAEVEQLVRRHTRARRKALIHELDRIAALTPNVPQSDSLQLLREDRTR